MKQFSWIFLVLLSGPLWAGVGVETLSTAEYEKNVTLDKFKEYESELATMFPHIAEYVRDKSDEERFVRYKNALYEQAFEEYENYFLTELRKLSEKTGRKLKTNTSYTYNYKKDPDMRYPCGYTKYYWLDNGELDTEKCNPNTKGMTMREALWAERQAACFFPDAYEEHMLVVVKPASQDKDFCASIVSNNQGHMYFDTEDANENIRLEYNVSLIHSHPQYSVSQENNVSYKADISMYKTEIDYNRYQEWRNQTVRDIRNGLYTDAEINDEENSVHLDKDYLNKWESSHNIPMGRITGFNSNYDFSINK